MSFLKRKQQYSWLKETSDGGALCLVCSQFYLKRSLPKGSDGTFISKPFTNWKKSTGSSVKDNKLLKHENSESHLKALCVSDEGQRIGKQSRSVYSMLHAQTECQRKEQLDRLVDYTARKRTSQKDASSGPFGTP